MNPMKPARSPWVKTEIDQWSALKELYAHRKQQRPSWAYTQLDAGHVNPQIPEAYLEAYRAWKAHPNEEAFFMGHFLSPLDGDLSDY